MTPAEDAGLEKYMQHPTISRQGIFTCRIHFRGETPLFVIKKSQHLMQWLRNENISIELNNLDFNDNIKLANVGFFVNCHPRHSIMVEQTERLKQLLPKTGVPEFTTYRSRIWNNNKVSCFVMMIKAKAVDIPT